MSAAAAKDVKPERLQPHEVVSRVEALLGAEGFTDFFHRIAYKLLSHGGAHANLRLIELNLRPRGAGHLEVCSDQQGNVSPDETALYSLVAHAFTASNVPDPIATPIAEEIHSKYLLG